MSSPRTVANRLLGSYSTSSRDLCSVLTLNNKYTARQVGIVRTGMPLVRHRQRHANQVRSNEKHPADLLHFQMIRI
jgi:hypothetical protein